MKIHLVQQRILEEQVEIYFNKIKKDKDRIETLYSIEINRYKYK